MNACVRKDISMDNFLFTCHDLHMSGDPNTRYLSSEEYEQLIIDSEDINLLWGFKNYLSIVHQWKEELLQQDKEDDNHEERPSPYLPENLPHNHDLENVFIEQLTECSTEVDYSSKFRGDMVLHLSIQIGNSKTSTSMLR
jgi:hypothetical protein